MNKKLIILVSSTVLGIEELLESIFALLSSLGYDVWMSYKGTIPVNSKLSNVENCLNAVRDCDLFLSIITTRYGSGIVKSHNKSITHLELEEAIRLGKPRWVLAHDHVSYTRTLLEKLGYLTSPQRAKLKLTKNIVFDDMRILDMYEKAISAGIDYESKKGDWVQTYQSSSDAMLFASAQFYRYHEVESFINEQFAKADNLRELLQSEAANEPD